MLIKIYLTNYNRNFWKMPMTTEHLPLSKRLLNNNNNPSSLLSLSNLNLLSINYKYTKIMTSAKFKKPRLLYKIAMTLI